MKNIVKLSEYAKIKGVGYRTIWNRYKNNQINNAFRDESNRVYVDITEYNNDDKKTILYARVSSNDRKNSLNEQLNRIENYAKINGFNVIKSFKEIASGMNDNRTILNDVFDYKEDWNYLIVENKDRLTRFGFNYIEKLLKKQGKQIIVVNNIENDKEDLMKDLISVIYSFSARMYGLRRKKNKQEIIDFIAK